MYRVHCLNMHALQVCVMRTLGTYRAETGTADIVWGHPSLVSGNITPMHNLWFRNFCWLADIEVTGCEEVKDEQGVT